jgi:hypothetical protein
MINMSEGEAVLRTFPVVVVLVTTPNTTSLAPHSTRYACTHNPWCPWDSQRAILCNSDCVLVLIRSFLIPDMWRPDQNTTGAIWALTELSTLGKHQCYEIPVQILHYQSGIFSLGFRQYTSIGL